MAHPKSKRITLKCPVCGNEYSANPTRLKWGRETTCSRECSYLLRSRVQATSVSFTCLNCGKLFTLPLSRLAKKSGHGKYCCRECRDLHRMGVNHPQYITGEAWDHHGPNWQRQRRKALRRDNQTCQCCGISSEQSGIPLHVHHIVPYREFENYQNANRLDNLISLCPSCHRIADAKVQANE